MKNISSLLFIILIISHSSLLNAEEMIIGEETIEPGINIIFEGAIKDSITPKEFYLSEKNSDIHIEALITWSKDGPEGSIEGGFVPYLEISVKIKNQNTNKEDHYTLYPHINLSDNFHYASNIKLPGKKDDIYEVSFIISPPSNGSLGFHYDWREKVNLNLISEKSFIYKDQNFKKWAFQNRK